MEGAQLMTCTVRTYHHSWSDHAHVQYNGTKPNWWQQQQGHPKYCWQQIKLAPVMYLIYLSQSIIDQFRLNQWHSVTKSNLRWFYRNFHVFRGFFGGLPPPKNLLRSVLGALLHAMKPSRDKKSRTDKIPPIKLTFGKQIAMFFQDQKAHFTLWAPPP